MFTLAFTGRFCVRLRVCMSTHAALQHRIRITLGRGFRARRPAARPHNLPRPPRKHRRGNAQEDGDDNARVHAREVGARTHDGGGGGGGRGGTA